MSKCFKKYAMLFIASLVIFSVSCTKDRGGSGGDGTGFVVEATGIVNGNDNIATVKAIMEDEQNDKIVSIATGKYENDGFKIILPSTVNSNYLYRIGDEFDDEEGMIISNPDAKVGGIALFEAYDESGNEIGVLFQYGEAPNGEAYAFYLYADRDFTIQGTSIDEDEEWYEVNIYDCSFKKGWNIMYAVEESGDGYYKATLTSQKPSGVTLKWYYDGEGGDDDDDDDGDDDDGDGNTQVRFKKTKAYEYVAEMSVDHVDGEELASYDFGTDAGTSKYYDIPPGDHYVLFYYNAPGNEDWYYCLDDRTYDFQEGARYTVVCDDDGDYLIFYVTHDGGAKSSRIGMKRKSASPVTKIPKGQIKSLAEKPKATIK